MLIDCFRYFWKLQIANRSIIEKEKKSQLLLFTNQIYTLYGGRIHSQYGQTYKGDYFSMYITSFSLHFNVFYNSQVTYKALK